MFLRGESEATFPDIDGDFTLVSTGTQFPDGLYPIARTIPDYHIC